MSCSTGTDTDTGQAGVMSQSVDKNDDERPNGR